MNFGLRLDLFFAAGAGFAGAPSSPSAAPTSVGDCGTPRLGAGLLRDPLLARRGAVLRPVTGLAALEARAVAPFAAPPDLGCVAAAAASDIVQVPRAGALPARSGVRLARTNSDILKVGQSRSSSGWGWMGSREKIFAVRGPKSLTCADPTPIAKLTGQSEGDESFPSRGAKVEETRECAIERRHYDTHYTLETMFAMTSLVGTPVVATPARATRAVRSTETVAIFKKGAPKAAPKKGAKKVRPKPVHRAASATDADPLPPG